MNADFHARRRLLQGLALTGTSLLVPSAFAADPNARGGLKEPVFRVAKAGGENTAPMADTHPLDPALKLAEDTLARIQAEVNDYTATIVKRERVKGVLGNYEFMQAKVRNRKVVDGRTVQPLSVYLKFLKPDDVKGREVIWVEGQNNNKMRAHEGGIKGRFLPTVWLPPDGMLAMQGQLHPITEIGIENLVVELIKRGKRERQHGECEVKFEPGAKINNRPCTVLSVRHPVPREYFEFHLAQIFIDDENGYPVRYAAYLWPQSADDKTGPVIEEYTYLDLKANVGLTDADFDPENPNYNF